MPSPFDIVTAGAFAYPQIVGADPLLRRGIGTDELMALDRMGIAGAALANQNGLAQAVLAQKLAQNSLVTASYEPSKAREYYLGFDSGAALIPAGGFQNVVNRPQVVFRPERLLVPSDIAGSFTIDSLVVGKNNQSASLAAGAPARVFDERAVGVRLMLDTAQISMDVMIGVTNIGGAAARFRAAMIGPAIE